MSADHITSMPCEHWAVSTEHWALVTEQVSNTPPTFWDCSSSYHLWPHYYGHILLNIISDHIASTCLQVNMSEEQTALQGGLVSNTTVSFKTSLKQLKALIILFLLNENMMEEKQQDVSRIAYMSNIHPRWPYSDLGFRTKFCSSGLCCFSQSLSFFFLSLHSVWPRWNKYSFS